MGARVVIGANFGDEGKGLVTDWLCRRQPPDVVVRFNGGAQAGHTVVTPDGKRHVFGHFGSGSFMRVPTFLSQYFVTNPTLFCKELVELREKIGADPRVYVHPDCMVTTIPDMLLNRLREKRRGFGYHGSCGIGFNETIKRHAHYPLTMRDLWEHKVDIESFVCMLLWKYIPNEIGESVTIDEEMLQQFVLDCRAIAEFTDSATIRAFNEPLFEGAQGLLLDRDRMEYWPHLTNSKTGVYNVLQLCDQAKIEAIEPYYVSRTYMTRHGKGHLPHEDSRLSFRDSTNVWNEWQEGLRFAPLDSNQLLDRIRQDVCGHVPILVMTHCDQYSPEPIASYYVSGETADDVLNHRDYWRGERANGEKIASASS